VMTKMISYDQLDGVTSMTVTISINSSYCPCLRVTRFAFSWAMLIANEIVFEIETAAAASQRRTSEEMNMNREERGNGISCGGGLR